MESKKVTTLENLRYFKSRLMTYINQPHDDNEWLKIVYPIGSIYISTSEISPYQLFGFGVWEQIKDVFLLTAGDTYQANSTGGESSHTLTVEEIPSHAHEFNRHQLWREEEVPVSGLSDGYGVSNKTLDVYRDITTIIGGTQPHNNMPPYLTVYA